MFNIKMFRNDGRFLPWIQISSFLFNSSFPFLSFSSKTIMLNENLTCYLLHAIGFNFGNVTSEVVAFIALARTRTFSQVLTNFIKNFNFICTEFKSGQQKYGSSPNEVDTLLVNSQLIYFQTEK